ncbi:UBX domain-containing protein 4 [Gadus morhua]|uniref:UBX domain-containing protein 4 n=1 Tax=Gadus morhua TaxID=8049 RepID=A0A8C4YUQ2_GADMO|nr:UBX domain-containing protein 4 [Gadus morhua]
MRWFEGSIPAAIASAKQQSLVFVVVITGEDEQSAQLQSSWEEDKVSEAAHNCCVAIKVDAKSETCTQFSQIYPVVCVPSSFFIGENGIPLEVVAGSVSAEDLLKRITKVQQMHLEQISSGGAAMPVVPMETTMSACVVPEPILAPAAAEDPAASPPEAGRSTPLPSNATAAGPSEEPLSRQAGGAGSHSEAATPGEEKSSSSDEAAHSSQPQENLDTKVDRLTKKLEDRREQKKKGEEEEEVRREMERRKQGKEMLDFKKQQEDDKTRRIMDERNREKAEEKAARDRVKQQIALDRADRAARYAKNQEEVEAARQAALQARQVEQEAKKDAAVRERSAIARIQFRLPDGSFFTNQFPAESLLLDAREFAVQETGHRYGNFSMATMFPRREFTSEDLNKSLLELELAPSASVVLLPQSSRASNMVRQAQGGGFWAILEHILSPLLAVWRYISGLIAPSPPPPAGEATGSGPAQPGASGGQPNRETLRKRTHEKRQEEFKKDGKIYRLRTQEDSEDDTNTWNGNSTQQM